MFVVGLGRGAVPRGWVTAVVGSALDAVVVAGDGAIVLDGVTGEALVWCAEVVLGSHAASNSISPSRPPRMLMIFFGCWSIICVSAQRGLTRPPILQGSVAQPPGTRKPARGVQARQLLRQPIPNQTACFVS